MFCFLFRYLPGLHFTTSPLIFFYSETVYGKIEIVLFRSNETSLKLLKIFFMLNRDAKLKYLLKLLRNIAFQALVLNNHNFYYKIVVQRSEQALDSLL